MTSASTMNSQYNYIFYNNYCCDKIANCASIPALPILGVGFLALGLITGTGAALSAMACRNDSRLIDFSAECFANFNGAITIMHMHVLHLLNSNVIGQHQLKENLKKEEEHPEINSIIKKNPFVIIENDLPCTFSEDIRATIRGWAQSCSESPYCLKTHIASRICYFLHLIAVLVTRIFDGAIGCVCAILSIIALGRSTTLNNWSVSYVYGGTKGASECFYSLIKMINPWIECGPYK